MTDDDLFFEFVEQVQREMLRRCDSWIEPGVEPHTIERNGRIVRFDADRARIHGSVGAQVFEAVARLCTN